jgi:hypothetical protein
MKRVLASVLLLSLCLVAAESSAAEVPTFGGRHVIKMFGGNDPVPPEWAGIWTTVDSMYTCAGVLQNVFTSTDTLCAGQTFDPDSSATECPFNCSGTATSTTVNMHCTGTCEVFEDCSATFTSDFVGTRTADSYFTVITMNTTFDGKGKGCDFFPDQCMQINSHGTRVGPAPEDYCSTPVESATWGRIKSRYR